MAPSARSPEAAGAVIERAAAGRLVALAVCVVALAASPGRAGSDGPADADPSPETIAALIRSLGDPDFQRRETATARLQEIGPAAVDTLLAAAETDADLEVAMRARWIVDAIPLEMLHDSPEVGRLLAGYSMGGYGAARLGFKFPDTFRGVSIMGGGPLQADLLDDAPRAGRRRAVEVLDRVYGGDPEYFRSVSPRALAERNAAAITRGSLVRVVCGDRDETFANNREFHEDLERLGIPHVWTVLPGVDHDPLRTLAALGDAHWEFYREVFGPPPAALPPRASDVDISFEVGRQVRRAVVVNAPTDGTTRATVLVLHGGMGSAESMRATSGFDAVAQAEGFMVVYAEGTAFGGDRHAWNTGHLMRRLVEDADDIAYFDTLIDTLVREHGADPTRVFMTGGSNGGMMTFVYAVARAERLAAIAPVVASMFTFDAKPSTPLPILIINGALDDEVPIEGGMSRNRLVERSQQAPFKPLTEVVRFWVDANRSQVEPTVETRGTVTTTVHAAEPDGAATVFVVDSAGGHGWPGTRPRREGSGPIRSFSGADKVWEFFRDKQRRSR